MTRIALFLGLFTPKRSMEQTSSQILHPEHRSGTTASFQDIFTSFKIPLRSPFTKGGFSPPFVKGRRGGISVCLFSTQYISKGPQSLLHIFSVDVQMRHHADLCLSDRMNENAFSPHVFRHLESRHSCTGHIEDDDIR